MLQGLQWRMPPESMPEQIKSGVTLTVLGLAGLSADKGGEPV